MIQCLNLETIPFLVKMLVGDGNNGRRINVYNDEGDPAKSWWKRKRFRGRYVFVSFELKFLYRIAYSYNNRRLIK